MPILIEEGTKNLIKNASFETGNTNAWIVSGAVTVQSTEKHFGSYAIRINDTSNTISATISQTVAATADTKYTLSAFCKIVSGTQYMSIDFLDSGNNVLAPYVIPFAETVWTRKAVTATSPANTTQARIRIYSTLNGVSDGYWDDIQFEAKPYATSVIYVNDSTTQAVRASEVLEIPSNTINSSEGTIEQWISPLYKLQPLPTGLNAGQGDKALIMTVPNHVNGGFLLYINDGDMYQLVFNNHWLAGPDNLTWNIGEWHHVAFTWSKTNNFVRLYLDGSYLTQSTYSDINITRLFVGSSSNGMFKHDDLRISNIARTDAEIAAAYASGQPLPIDEYTTAKLNFDNVLGLYEGSFSDNGHGVDTINQPVKTVFYVDGNNVLQPLGAIVTRDTRVELLPRTRDYTESVPLVDGEYDAGTGLDSRILELHCVIDIAPELRDAFKRKLVQYFTPKNGPQPLVFSDDLDKVYYIKYSGQMDSIQYPHALDFTVPLKMSDPYIKSTTVKTHVGNGVITNSGNIECPIIINVTGPTSQPVTITVGDQSITYNATLSDVQTLIIDTDKMTAKVAGGNVLKDINGDFIQLRLGDNDVNITGVSPQNVTIEYTEQWI